MNESKNRVSKVRSDNMRAIRSAGNRSTELRLRGFLVRHRIAGWKLHAKQLTGAPDFLFRKRRLAVFVDGCFWHGCPRCGHIPKTNQEYWSQKITRNKRRDRSASHALRIGGYRVIRLWECQLRNKPERCLTRIMRELTRDEG